jgi:fructose-bisphosphate aldolase class II
VDRAEQRHDHGIEASDAGIQVGLTAEIHRTVAPYKVSGAQHGTSGNSSERLRHIAAETHTTKANVATALQMISWGVKVNDYGNAELDANGEFIKVPGHGVTEEVWAKMAAFAKEKGWTKGDYKKLNLPFENILLGQSREVRSGWRRRSSSYRLDRGLARATRRAGVRRS